MHLVATFDALLLPRGLPPRPWAHPPYRATLTTMDTASLIVAVIINASVVAKSHRFLNIPFWERNAVPFLLIVQAALQSIWLHRWPASYFRHRHYLVLFNRVFRILTTLQVPMSIRRWHVTTTTPEHDIAVFTGGATPGRPPSWATPFSATMMTSGTLHALSSSVNWPMPTYPQIALQLTYVVLLTTVATKPAAACLALAPFPGALLGACSRANSLLAAAVSGLGGSDLDLEAAEQLCAAEAPLLLVTFCIWFFAGVLPVLAAYRVEQHVVRCVARAARVAEARRRGSALECDSEDWDGEEQRTLFGTVSVILSDTVLLFLAASMIWFGLLLWLPLLAAVMQPL